MTSFLMLIFTLLRIRKKYPHVLCSPVILLHPKQPKLFLHKFFVPQRKVSKNLFTFTISSHPNIICG
jgi:hypothetical protein